MRKLEEWERNFNSVGWFIPPYIQMGHLSSLASAIRVSNGGFTQDELERRMAYLYEPIGVAAMVCDRYPITPVISEYRQTIAEAVAAHFAGLHHIAVAGLIPVIEGAARELLNVRGEGAPNLGVRKVFATLASNCLEEVRRQRMGDALKGDDRGRNQVFKMGIPGPAEPGNWNPIIVTELITAKTSSVVCCWS